jgi:hypothetical protein
MSSLAQFPSNMQAPDTLVVITQSAARSPDLLPLWTGILGGLLGLSGTLFAARNAKRIALAQIDAQKQIATEQLRRQGDTSDRQIRASVLAANRVRWIEQLRSETVDFAAMCLTVATDLEAEAKLDIVNPKIDEGQRHAAHIELLLNHDEADSKEAIAVIHEVTDLMSELTHRKVTHDDVMRVNELLDQLGAIVRRVLKSEWNRVKALE